MTTDYNEENSTDIPRPVASFVVKQGPQIGIVFPIATDKVVLGREESCTIPLQDAEVSRRHSEVLWQDGKYTIQDLGSTNGTFVNGLQIAAPSPLKSGTTIGVGQSVLVFEMESVSPTVQPGYVAPPSDKSVEALFGDEKQGRFGNNKKWLFLGCGASILLSLCIVIVLLAIYLFGVTPV